MVELGDGYRLDASMVEVVVVDVCGGSEGDRERTDRGDEERMEGVALRSERGEDGGDGDEDEDEDEEGLVFLAGESIGQALRGVARCARRGCRIEVGCSLLGDTREEVPRRWYAEEGEEPGT